MNPAMGRGGPQMTRAQQEQMLRFNRDMRQKKVELLTAISDSELEITQLCNQDRIAEAAGLQEWVTLATRRNDCETRRTLAIVALRQMDIEHYKNEVAAIDAQLKMIESGLIVPSAEGVMM